MKQYLDALHIFHQSIIEAYSRELEKYQHLQENHSEGSVVNFLPTREQKRVLAMILEVTNYILTLT